jgi:muramoyltetrapeptide carboxypeptidase
MITPPPLYPDSTVGLVSPAKKINAGIIENAVQIIRQLGFKVKLGQNLLAGAKYFAGTDKQRTADFQQMLDDPEVGLILCSRGGYGSARIIDKLDFASFKKHPKWIAGYSDITVFHNHLFNLGFESLHCTMPLDFKTDGQLTEPVKQLFEVASGKPLFYEIDKSKWNRNGLAEGMLVGGNLSVFVGLVGSASEVDTAEKMLFLEDVGEDLYRIDRMMVSLKRAGKLNDLSGLILGGFTGTDSNTQNFDLSFEEIILDAVSAYNYPVAFGFPAGHFPENYPLVMGREMSLEVGEKVVLRGEM